MKFNQVFVEQALVTFDNVDQVTREGLAKILPITESGEETSCWLDLEKRSLKDGLAYVQLMGNALKTYEVSIRSVRVDLSFDTKKFNQELVSESQWVYDASNVRWERQSGEATIAYYQIFGCDWWRYTVSANRMGKTGLKNYLEKIQEKARY
jgi:hypothetical protein